MNTEQALTDLNATLDCLTDHLGDSTFSLEISKAVTALVVSIYGGINVEKDREKGGINAEIAAKNAAPGTKCADESVTPLSIESV